MNKYLTLMACAVSFLILFGWTAHISMTASTAPTVKLPITGYDPRSLLSGHYIVFQIDWQRADCAQFSRSKCPRERFRGRQRFYVPEQSAAALDARLRETSMWQNRGDTNADVFEVIYYFPKKGKPNPKQLLINGIDWREIVK